MKFNIKLSTIEEVKKFCDYALDCCNDEIYIKQGRYVIDAKSIMGIFSLDLLKELELNIDNPTDDCFVFFEKIKELGIVKVGE